MPVASAMTADFKEPGNTITLSYPRRPNSLPTRQRRFSSNAPCPNGFSRISFTSGIRSNTAIDHFGANTSIVQPG
ncbi:hypothetical protein AAIB25_06675 [Neisseria gonorrhoeae]